jgi:hypothetical protein
MGITSFITLKIIFAHKPISERKLDQLADEVMRILNNGIFKQPPSQQHKAILPPQAVATFFG